MNDMTTSRLFTISYRCPISSQKTKPDVPHSFALSPYPSKGANLGFSRICLELPVFPQIVGLVTCQVVTETERHTWE
jgi:hypothetical protein